MIDNSYKIEQVLLEILHTVASDSVGEHIMELLTLLNEFGYGDLDTLILNELLGVEIETNDTEEFIKNKLLKISVSVLQELGIGMSDNITLPIVINILLTLYVINNIDSSLKEPLLTILEDSEKDNLEKIAVIVSLHSDGQFVEIFESIEYVTDIFISTYADKLRNEFELSEDADTDMFDESFKLMTDIINIDSVMTTTTVVRTMMSGVDINTNMDDHIPLIVSTIDSVSYNTKEFAANLATLLYICENTNDDMLGNYKIYFEDNLLVDVDMDIVEEITKYVRKYTYELSLIKRN